MAGGLGEQEPWHRPMPLPPCKCSDLGHFFLPQSLQTGWGVLGISGLETFDYSTGLATAVVPTTARPFIIA